MQTGRFFTDPNIRDSRRAQQGIKPIFSQALQRFHQASDELEEELVRSQQILRRDLALLRIERQKKEEAEAAAEKARLAAQHAAVKQETPSNLPPQPESVQDTTATQSDDIIMTDSLLTEERNDAVELSGQAMKKEPSTESRKPPPLTMPSKTIETETTNDKPSTAVTETPATADANMDFDELFKDLADLGGNDDGDINMDLNTDLSLNTENVESGLLPGLETYANSAGNINLNESIDLTMGNDIDVQNNTNNLGNPTNTSSNDQDNLQQNTDDINLDPFGYDPLGLGEDTDDFTGAPEDSAFDDAWLDLTQMN
jgi:hypothetical protein